MKDYEAIIILKPELDGDALKVTLKEILDMLKKYNCNIENVDEWGKRALSYEIKKKKEGLYHLANFKATPENIVKINREFRLNENVLRAMVSLRNKEKAQA